MSVGIIHDVNRQGLDVAVKWRGDLQEALCKKLEPAGRDTLGVGPEKLRHYVQLSGQEVTVENGYVTLDAKLISIEIKLDNDARPAAEEFADKAAAVFPEVFAEMDKENNKALGDEMNRALDDTDKQIMELQSEIQTDQVKEHMFQENLNGLGMVDTDSDDIHKLAQNLEEQREMSLIDRAATDARRDALAKAVAKLTDDIRAKADNDDIVSVLQQIEDAKEAKLKEAQAMADKGLASPSEVLNVEADAAEAKVKVLQRREDVAKTVGGDALIALQTELQNVEVNSAEAEAKDQAMHELAHSLISAQELTSKVKAAQQDENDLAMKLDAAKQAAVNAQSEIDQTPLVEHHVVMVPQ
jgi:hypothetical protein